MTKLTDKEIEKLWIELEDITFVEDVESCKELVLGSDWLHFKKGTWREDIWRWFDKNHSKGVAWLMYELEF